MPAADVGGISKRIAERLEMDPQRIHTLLNGRKGPVTKPVLPDKAAAIAEVFAEAGVAVEVVPASDAVVSFVSGGEQGAGAQVEKQFTHDSETRFDADDEPDFGPEPELELEPEFEPEEYSEEYQEAPYPEEPYPETPRPAWDTSSAWAVEDTGSWSALRPVATERSARDPDPDGSEDRPGGRNDAWSAEPEYARRTTPGRPGAGWPLPEGSAPEAADDGAGAADPEEEADRLGPRSPASDISVFTTSTRWVPSPHDGYVSDDVSDDAPGDEGYPAAADPDRGWSGGGPPSAGRGTGVARTSSNAYNGAQWIQPPARAEAPRLRPYLVWSLIASGAVFLLLQYVMAGRMEGAPALGTLELGMNAYRSGDFGAARRSLEPEAEAGNHLAQYYLGYMAQNGLGQPWSNAKAAAYYRRAADGGVPEAQLALGDLYLRGMGVERDDVAGASWYARAAALGYPQGQYEYGKLLLHGTGVPRNPVAALAQFRAAAATGLTAAADYVAFAMEALREDDQ